MSLREITADDLATLNWIDLTEEELRRVDFEGTGGGWWRIVAEMVCHSCGAFQAVDSDPTNDKGVATTLAVRLFIGAGWRVNENGEVRCEACCS